MGVHVVQPFQQLLHQLHDHLLCHCSLVNQVVQQVVTIDAVGKNKVSLENTETALHSGHDSAQAQIKDNPSPLAIHPVDPMLTELALLHTLHLTSHQPIAMQCCATANIWSCPHTLVTFHGNADMYSLGTANPTTHTFHDLHTCHFYGKADTLQIS